MLQLLSVCSNFQLPNTGYRVHGWRLRSKLSISVESFHHTMCLYSRDVCFQQPSQSIHTPHPMPKLTLKLNPGHMMHPCGSVARGYFGCTYSLKYWEYVRCILVHTQYYINVLVHIVHCINMRVHYTYCSTYKPVLFSKCRSVMNIKIFVHPDLNTIVDTNILHYDHDLGLQTN